MLDDQHARAGLAHMFDEKIDIVAFSTLQPRRRFVQQQHFRGRGERHRQPQHFLQAVRQLVGLLVQALCQAELAQQVFQAFRKTALTEADGAHDVFAHRNAFERVGLLEAAREAEAANGMRRLVGDVAPIEDDAPGRCRLPAGNNVDQRRLTRPVRPDNAEQRTGWQYEGNILEDPQAAEAFGEALDTKFAHRILRTRDATVPTTPPRNASTTTRISAP